MRYIFFFFFPLLLASCNLIGSGNHTSENHTPVSANTTFTGGAGNYRVTFLRDYTVNQATSIKTATSFGSKYRGIYILVNAESKEDITYKNLDAYFEAITPDFDNITITKLDPSAIPNPRKYTVQDYRITGEYSHTNIVWYMRVIDTGTHFVQVNSWTTPSKESANKTEIFTNIALFEWLKTDKKEEK